MMQALLADRFKLVVHHETKQEPVMALVLDKPGKLGPHLQQHPTDQPCSSAGSMDSAAPTVAGGFPERCGSFAPLRANNPGRVRMGGRDVPMEMLASTFSSSAYLGSDRPVIDRTGLTGGYDFVIEFSPIINGPLPPGVNFTPDPNGPTFLEALKEQLGLTVKPMTGPVDLIVVDHVDELSEN